MSEEQSQAEKQEEAAKAAQPKGYTVPAPAELEPVTEPITEGPPAAAQEKKPAAPAKTPPALAPSSVRQVKVEVTHTKKQ